MSDSSDEDLGSDWIPYSSRNDWADVVPLEQDDGENPIVAIAYSSKFREVFDYFRAILAKQEKSLRALDLTSDALRLNTSNYTVWQYRREILNELKSDLKKELDYICEVIRENAKNYQVWHHRRVIVEMLNDASQELAVTQMALEADAKNYHAWQHRQWAIQKYDLYENELNFVDRLIADDIRNNSAWNQRFFILKSYGFTTDVIQRELHYTMNRIRVVKNNESAWNYLIGVLRQSDTGELNHFPEVIEFSEELYNAGNRSPFLLSFLIDLYQEQCLRNECAEERDVLARKVYGLCDELAKKHDHIRRKYWGYIADKLKEELNEKKQ
ncbi:protein farnesyltransferase/geranylgeranyltransferase type-1 subunit alpha [Teleopsis dalmanni]|uniref:protein farnesyltransferase/geranylgeranyltransferase type-1 subunit alpha n=1 Tax=Teleopsis dalmanni TaxID=139649 RepID=UPI0018CFE965|nr:protein farnesyltransferase/geranylgeranyltransferase type-1 subunit alpha [Teleopsis dalmanni]